MSKAATILNSIDEAIASPAQKGFATFNKAQALIEKSNQDLTKAIKLLAGNDVTVMLNALANGDHTVSKLGVRDYEHAYDRLQAAGDSLEQAQRDIAKNTTYFGQGLDSLKGN